MSKLLDGKTVVITGASRGIGECLACCMAREGANLVLVAEDQDQLKQVGEKVRSEGSKQVDTLTCDLADAQAVQKLADKLADMNVDVAVMNAGVFMDTDLLKGNPDEWDRMMRINAMAPMRIIRALAPTMTPKAKGSGAIVCIGDVEAVHTGPSHAAYAASKYALRGFCKSAYEALRGQGVRVMNVAAGNVGQTAMAKETGKLGGQGAIEPEDVAEAVLLAFRCSPNCVPEEIVLKAAQPGNA